MAHGPPARRKPDDENDEVDELPVPPDGGWGWVVVFGSLMVHIITDGITYSFGIFYVEFLSYFKEGKGYTAWIASLLVGVTLCSGPVSSALVNRYGCRVVTIVGALIAGVSIFFSVFAQNVFTLIITIGVGAGFGLGLIYLPAIVSVTMYFEKYRSLATGIAVCGSGFGTFIFAPLTELLVQTYGWRGAMLIIAAIVLHCMLFGALFRPLKPPPKKPQLPDTELYPIRELDEVNENDDDVEQQNQNNNDSNNNNNNSNSIKAVPENPHRESRSRSDLSRSVSVGHGMVKNLNVVPQAKREPIPNAPAGNPQDLEKRYEGLRTTLSSPLLNADLPSNLQTHKFTKSGTMYRPDILYQGSVYNIPHYKSHTNLSEFDKYSSFRQSSIIVPATAEKCCGCVPTQARDSFFEMMNFSLFKDPVFVLFTASNFSTSIGFNVPYVYLAAQAEVLEISKDRASYLLAIIGIANTIGRIFLGYIADKPWVNRLYVYNVMLTTCGVATAFSIFTSDFTGLAIYAAVFGFTIGAYVGLTSVILVDLLGLDKLTNAFGLLLLFQGIASLVGPPVAGTLYDLTGSYGPGFLLAGITIALSGAMLFAIPALRRHLAKKNRITSHDGLVMSL